MTSRLDALWVLADELGRASKAHPDYVFDPCGLILQRPLERSGYFCTPKNSLTFASTGGDGVHFGFLQLDLSPDEQPVVMTVPMADRHNVAVAENLSEFLNLGYFNGWFSLEQLVYDPEEAVRMFNSLDGEDWPERESLLELIRAKLGLELPRFRGRFSAWDSRVQGRESLVGVEGPKAPAGWRGRAPPLSQHSMSDSLVFWFPFEFLLSV